MSESGTSKAAAKGYFDTADIPTSTQFKTVVGDSYASIEEVEAARFGYPDLATSLAALNLSGLSTTTRADGGETNGATTITVLSTVGFETGDTIGFATVTGYQERVATVTNPTTFTVAAINGDLPDRALVLLVPPVITATANSIPSGRFKTLTLPQVILHLAHDFHNVKAYGAVGDGVTDDTQAFIDAMGVDWDTIVSGSGSSIVLANGTMFANGNTIEISQNNNTIHKTTIASGGGTPNITLALGLTNTVSAGNLVVEKDQTTIVNPGIVYVPTGTYKISRQIPFRRSIHGARFKGDSTILAATSGYKGSQMLDLQDTDGFLHVQDIRFDANGSVGVRCIGNDDIYDGGGTTWERVGFYNSAAGVYAVGMGGGTPPTGSGVYVGHLFTSCHWVGCSSWFQTRIVSDDVTFISCRFDDSGPQPPATMYYMDLNSTNVSFLGCFFNVGPSTEDGMMVLRTGNYSFRNCFFEENGTATGTNSIFRGGDANIMLNLDMIQFNLNPTSTTGITHIVHVLVHDGTRSQVRLGNLYHIGSPAGFMPKLLKVASFLNLSLHGTDDYVTCFIENPMLWGAPEAEPFYEITGTNHAQGVLRIYGIFNGKMYHHSVTNTAIEYVDYTGSVDELSVGTILADTLSNLSMNSQNGAIVIIDSNNTSSGEVFRVRHDDGTADAVGTLLEVTEQGNVGINTTQVYGTGQGVLAMGNANVVPSTNPTSGGILYTEGGALKYRSQAGNITVIAAN